VCALLRHHLAGQLEVELSGFAGPRLCVENRCFDSSIDKETDFIITNRKAIANVMAVATGLDDLGKIFRFNLDIGAFDWTLVGGLSPPLQPKYQPRR
jgi:hypothetical protein